MTPFPLSWWFRLFCVDSAAVIVGIVVIVVGNIVELVVHCDGHFQLMHEKSKSARSTRVCRQVLRTLWNNFKNYPPTHTKKPQQTLIKYCSNQQSCVQIRQCLVLLIDMIFSGIFFSAAKHLLLIIIAAATKSDELRCFMPIGDCHSLFSHTPRTLSTSINHHVFSSTLVFFFFHILSSGIYSESPARDKRALSASG